MEESKTSIGKPSILMKEGEYSDKKRNVKFDESKNIIKEFRKGDRIQNKYEYVPKKTAV